MPGESHLPGRCKCPWAPAEPAPRGAAGAHIAELIKTMLEKKASGIDLK